MKVLTAFETIKRHHPTLGGKEIVNLINAGKDEFCMRSKIFKQAFSQNTTAGQRYYTLDAKIFRILSVTFNEIEIPRIIGSINIDDDELSGETGDLASTYNLSASSTTSKERGWYEDLGRIAIVEKREDAIKRDDIVSQYQSITSVGLLRIKTISAPVDVSDSSSGNDILAGVPGNFDRYVINFAIAEGYRLPDTLDPQKAEYFDAQFEKGVKKAKKFANSSYTTSGTIKPHDF